MRFAIRPRLQWTGGVNYFNSLLQALQVLPDRRVEPVMLLPSRSARLPEGFPDTPVLATPIFDRSLFHTLNHHLGEQRLLRWQLRHHDIAALSHVMREEDLWQCQPGRMPGLAWIADFQHKHLPEYFSADELRGRDEGFARLAAKASRVILSSEDARQDMARFYPEWADKARVLRFVSLPPCGQLTDPKALDAIYGLDRPFFYLPNQFWKHKNHALVIEALAHARARHPEMLVAATGTPADYRHPEYYDELVKRVAELGLSASFRFLGAVPYDHVMALMAHCLAVINPSRFEGWSTTVEEAKTLGVMMLLSNIGVHREQAGEGAAYFDPDCAEALADLMSAVWRGERVMPARARDVLAMDHRRRQCDVAACFQEILLETMT